MQIKKIIATLAITSVLVIGAVTASAQEGNHRGNRGFAANELVETYTGLSGSDLRQALADGSTIADLIEANGQSVDAFLDEALTDMQTRLDEAVANERIDQATADERLAEFEAQLTERINQIPEFNVGNRFDGRNDVAGELVESYTGLSGEDLRQALADGSTIAELIEANGQSVDAFLDEALTDMQTRLDEAVANERIDQETADERLAEFEAQLTERINQIPEFNVGNRFDGRNDVAGELVESYTGLSGEDLRQALADGSTIAELIEANGQSVEAFLQDAIAAMQTRLDEAVAAENIDQATADERLAEFEIQLPERINSLVDFDRDGRGGRGHGRGFGDA